MAVFQKRRMMIAVSPVEATPGTDEFTVLTLTDQQAIDQYGMIVYELDPQPLGNAESFTRKPMGPGLSVLPPVPGKRHSTVSFQILAHGAAAAGTAPIYKTALRGAGMSETIVGGVSVAYTSDEPDNTVTVWIWHDGLKYIMTGTAFKFASELRAGEPVKFNLEGSGIYLEPTDVAAPTYGLTDVVPPPWLNASISLFGVGAGTLFVSAVDLDLGDTITMRQDVNQAGGYVSALKTDKEGTGSIDPELVLQATHNFWKDWTDPTSGILTTTWGTGAGKIMNINCPNVSPGDAPSLGDRDSLSILEYPLMLAASAQAADDEFTLKFT